MIRDDYIVRLIKQIADFLGRIARRREQGRIEDALAEADRAWSELFDIPRDLVHVVDTSTLAGILRHPERIRAAARLFREEGQVYTAKGDPLSATLRFKRALELFLEAQAIAPSEEDDATLAELSRLIPASELDPGQAGC